MRKNRILALALAGAITFMGAGYAAWTDSINIETTIKSGNLSVVFQDSTDMYKNEAYFVTYKDGKVDTKILSEKEAYIHSDDKTEFTVDASNYLLMPSNDVTPRVNSGDTDGRELPGLRIRTCMVNNGTIPAKFDNIEIDGPENSVYDQLMVERFVGVRVFDGQVQGNWGNEWKVITAAEGDWRGNDKVVKAIIKFVDDSSNELKDYNLNSTVLETCINNIFKDVVLENGQNVSLVTVSDLKASKEFAPRLRIYLNPDADESVENCKSCEFTIKFNWKQTNQ